MITAGAAVLPGTGRLPTMGPTVAGYCHGRFPVAAALSAATTPSGYDFSKTALARRDAAGVGAEAGAEGGEEPVGIGGWQFVAEGFPEGEED